MAASKNLKQLMEERSELIVEATKRKEDLEKADRPMTDDDVKYFMDSAAKRESLDKDIEVRQKMERLVTPLPKPEEKKEERGLPGRENTERKPEAEDDKESRKTDKATDEQRALAFRTWANARAGRLESVSEEAREAVTKCGLSLNRSEIEIPMWGSYPNVQRRWKDGSGHGRESRALSNLNLAAGGALVPEGFINQLEIALLAYGGLRDAADVMRTESGNPMPMPTVNDTTNKATLLAENTAVSAVDIALKQITFSAYKFTSGIVNVPIELLQDSAFNVESYVGNLLGIRIARGLNDFYTTGTGASQPRGIVTAVVAETTPVTAASATGIAMEDVVNLVHNVDPMYRPGGSFMCHDSVILALKKLKDGVGRFYWTDGSVQQGEPNRLWGYPVITNQSMQSVLTSFSSGYNTLLFGEIKKFVVREVAAMRLVVLRERYADSDQVAFVAFMRADSNLIDAGTHPIKVLQH